MEDHKVEHDEFPEDRVEDGHYSHKYSQQTWASALKHHEYTMVNFFVPWCPWSRRLGPVWDEAAEILDKIPWTDIGVSADMVRADCQANSALCRQERVMAFPTIRLYHKEQAVFPEYNGRREAQTLVDWLIEKVADPLVQEHHSFENFTDRGCRIEGSIEVPRVPGNFHLEARSAEHTIDATMTNVSHLVHHLSFGKKAEESFISNLPAEDQRRINPLENKNF
eukprot:UN29088